MRFYIGIDSGASKTLGRIIDQDGQVLAAARGPGVALDGVPTLEQTASLASLLAELCAQARLELNDAAALGLGLNGAQDFAEDETAQRQALAQGLGLSRVPLTLKNDGIAALWGATDQEAAVILQHGSGYIGAWRHERGAEQLMDPMNMARLFDLRDEAVKLVSRMLHGLRPNTGLKERLLEHWGVHDEDSLRLGWFRGGIPAARKRDTPPLIFDAWSRGDEAARELVLHSAQDFGLAAGVMALRTGRSSPIVAFGGGVVKQAPEAYLQLLAQEVRRHCPGARVARPRLSPEDGACLMAAHSAKADTAALFQSLETNQDSQRHACL